MPNNGHGPRAMPPPWDNVLRRRGRFQEYGVPRRWHTSEILKLVVACLSMALHGFAIILLPKTEHTMQDAFEVHSMRLK